MSDRTKNARTVFAAIDKDGDGVATLEEIKAALKRACVADPIAEAIAMLDGKAGITFDQFYHHMKGGEPFAALAFFALSDTNNDGKISKDELQTSLAQLEEAPNVSEVFSMMDTDHDGLVSYAEVKAFFKQL